ncbi:hypothetical protein ASF88_01285 [Leifsonia sp. Leaf336]|uniref:hypothetical protein n=1 Tax=Leifsonia sp. Leaf336 TaxID=1736341 RepID=UPI0006F9B4B8|nr:hypothetical protein [Leifsonia sp. Leaf336]KQR53542.1 hypothetical protein ASF88_01285 [Leifsonia sp. Leaf336]
MIIEGSRQREATSLSVAAAVLVGSVILHAIVGVTSTVLTPWETLLHDSPVNRGLTTMGFVLGAGFGAGLFIAVPIAAATDVRARRRRSITFAVLNLAVALAALFFGYWVAVISATLAVLAIVLLARKSSRSALTVVDHRGRGQSLTVGYLLWAIGGLWGLHNFYLKRSWASVLYIGLLIFGTGTWGGLMSYLCVGLLGGMLLIDLFLMPTRVRRLVQDAPFIR